MLMKQTAIQPSTSEMKVYFFAVVISIASIVKVKHTFNHAGVEDRMNELCRRQRRSPDALDITDGWLGSPHLQLRLGCYCSRRATLGEVGEGSLINRMASRVP